MTIPEDSPLVIERKLKQAQEQLADVVKHAYVVIYVDGMLRSLREDRTFFDVICSELKERGLLDTAEGILAFERFRAGLTFPKNEVELAP